METSARGVGILADEIGEDSKIDIDGGVGEGGVDEAITSISVCIAVSGEACGGASVHSALSDEVAPVLWYCLKNGSSTGTGGEFGLSMTYAKSESSCSWCSGTGSGLDHGLLSASVSMGRSK